MTRTTGHHANSIYNDDVLSPLPTQRAMFSNGRRQILTFDVSRGSRQDKESCIPRQPDLRSRQEIAMADRLARAAQRRASARYYAHLDVCTTTTSTPCVEDDSTVYDIADEDLYPERRHLSMLPTAQEPSVSTRLLDRQPFKALKSIVSKATVSFLDWTKGRSVSGVKERGMVRRRKNSEGFGLWDDEGGGRGNWNTTSDLDLKRSISVFSPRASIRTRFAKRILPRDTGARLRKRRPNINMKPLRPTARLSADSDLLKTPLYPNIAAMPSLRTLTHDPSRATISRGSMPLSIATMPFLPSPTSSGLTEKCPEISLDIPDGVIDWDDALSQTGSFFSTASTKVAMSDTGSVSPRDDRESFPPDRAATNIEGMEWRDTGGSVKSGTTAVGSISSRASSCSVASKCPHGEPGPTKRSSSVSPNDSWTLHYPKAVIVSRRTPFHGSDYASQAEWKAALTSCLPAISSSPLSEFQFPWNDPAYSPTNTRIGAR